MPIYHVTSPDGERVVEASTPAGAIAHVARNTITAKNLTATDLVYLLQEKGLKVEKAKAEAAEPAAAKPAEEKETNG